MGGLRFVVGACGKNRRASVLLFTPHDSSHGRGLKKTEMLHWYVAQGWSKQHHMQQVMLCRVRDLTLAQQVVHVLKKTLRIGHCSVRSLNTDNTECSTMLRLWNDSYGKHPSERIPLIRSGEMVHEAAAAKSAELLSECIPFLKALTESSPMIGLLNVVTELLSEVDISSKRPNCMYSRCILCVSCMYHMCILYLSYMCTLCILYVSYMHHI